MLGALKEAASILERRFLLNAFLPSMIFWGALLVLYIGTNGGMAEAAAAWTAQDLTLKAIVVLGFLAWVWFFAGIVASQWRRVIRWYEGYWGPRLGWLYRLGQAWHQRRLIDLLQDDQIEKASETYPLVGEAGQVMPTRLGNILKTAELYSTYRYNADCVLLWPRLYPLFPTHFVTMSAEARASLELLLVVSAFSVAFGVLAGAWLVIVEAHWAVFLLVYWGSLLTAFLTYHGSTDSAESYGQQLRAGFDLYRQELLKQLRLPLPATLAEERQRWDEVHYLFVRNMRPRWRFVDGPATPLGRLVARRTEIGPPLQPAVDDEGPPDEDEEEPSRGRGLGTLAPLAAWFSVVALMTGVTGACWLAAQSRVGVEAWVAAHDLPAFHQMSARDLKLRKLTAKELKGVAVRGEDQLVGRYTLVAIRGGTPIITDRLGPVVGGDAIKRSTVLGIETTLAAASASRLTRGAVVDLLFLPSRSMDAESRAPVRLRSAIVLDVPAAEPPRGPYVVIVAIPKAQQGDLSKIGGLVPAFVRPPSR